MYENKKEWLIWSNEHGGWWAVDSQGYVKDRDEAGRYSFIEACGIVERANKYLAKDAEPYEAMVRA